MAKPFTIPFDAAPDVAIATARAQGVVLPAQYYALQAERRAQAFTVSGLAKLDQVQAVADKLAAMQADGGTLRDFQKWAKDQDWSLPRHRLETIYRNATQTAYMAGHWRSFEESKDALPYLMYDAINDSRTRPHHLALDGVIRPVGDAFWKTHACPNGHRCRCSIRALSRDEAMRRGGVTQTLPAEGGADAGWGTDPREWGKTLRELVRERQSACKVNAASFGRKQRPVAQNLDCTDFGAKMLADMLQPKKTGPVLSEENRNAFASWAFDVLSDDYRARNEFKLVGYLPENVLNDSAVKEFRLATNAIEISDYQLRHGMRAHKKGRGTTLDAVTLANLPERLASSTWYFDSLHRNVIAAFDVGSRDMLGKAVVQFSFKRRNQTHNAVITTGVVGVLNLADVHLREIK